MEHGQIKALVQPAELIIIGGAGIGTLLIANPLSTIVRILKGVGGVLKGSPNNQAFYLSSLTMLNDLFVMARKQGLVKLEEDLENPSKSQVFSKYSGFLSNHDAQAFVCDTLRMAISGGVAAFDLDQMMESGMDVHHHEASRPVTALSTVADSCPGRESWPRCSAWSSPWARWEARRRRLATRWRPRWSARFGHSDVLRLPGSARLQSSEDQRR